MLQNDSTLQVLLGEETKEFCFGPSLIKMIDTAFEQACTGFIVQLSKPLCFLSAWKHVAKISLHRHNPRILFLSTATSGNISPEIMKSKETDIILDMIVVEIYTKQSTESEENRFKIFTSDHTSKGGLLAECKATECANDIVYLQQNKMLGFKNKALKVATFNYPPYAILDPLDGTEVRIAFEYAKQHNCSINIVTDSAQWGQIYENGTGDGILGNVAEERADIGLGALYLWYHEYQFLDFSVPYIRTGITCLVPKPALLSTLLLPIRPFTLLTWLIVVFSLLVACTALYLTKKLDISLSDIKNTGKNKMHRYWFTTKEDTALRAFGFLLLQAYNSCVLETSSVRHLVNCLHIMFLLVATSYSSGLASILTVPSYLPPIDSVWDLVSSGLPWGATHDAWIFSLREATEPQMRTLVNRFKAFPKEQLQRNSITADFAFSIERLPAGHFAIGDYITEDSMKHLRLMKQDIYYEHCIIVFQKGSPYLSSFNLLIHRLLDSGLLLFWEGEVARKFLNSPVQSAVRESTTAVSRAHPTTIHLSHLQGAFIILGIGLFTASLVFIIEVYIGYKHKSFRRGKSNIKTIEKIPYYGFYK